MGVDVTCRECDHKNPIGSRFCALCGAPLHHVGTLCPSCGAESTDGGRFCNLCGAVLQQTARERDERSARSESSSPRRFHGSSPTHSTDGAHQVSPADRVGSGSDINVIDSQRDPDSDGDLSDVVLGAVGRSSIVTTSLPDDLVRLRSLAEQWTPLDVDPVDTRVDPTGYRSGRVERAIAAFVLIALLIPLVMKLAVPNIGEPPPARAFVGQLDSLPAGSQVLVAFEWSPSSIGEMEPISRQVLQMMLGRGLKVIAISTNPTGAALAERVYDSLPNAQQYPYGEAFINLGYLSGGEAGLVAFSDNVPAMTPVDNRFGKPLADWPETHQLRSLTSVRAIVVISDNDEAVVRWLQQVRTRYNVPMLAAVSAGAEPMLLPYTQVAQPGLNGLIGGLPELASTLSGSRDAGGFSNQSLLAAVASGQLVIAGLIVLGNLAVVVQWIRKRSVERALA